VYGNHEEKLKYDYFGMSGCMGNVMEYFTINLESSNEDG
jgi:hypothetical protein